MEQSLFVGIVVRDPLVSHDIADTFDFWQAGSICRIFDTIAAARSVPPDVFNPALIFIAPQDGVLTDLDTADFRWLEGRGVMTLDLLDPSPFPHWQHLTRPFTQAHVIQAAHLLAAFGQPGGG